jgi:hypothetical protein
MQMNNILLPPINIPCTLFETITLFDDFSADDMQYGDMEEQDFLSLGLSDISAKVDPYRLIKYHFPGPNSTYGAFSVPTSGTKISQSECIDILFAEMKDLAKMFSFFGQYKTLIQDLIDHFRYGNGNSFHSQELNLSFHERINKYDYNSPIRVIKECIENDISSTPTTGYRPLLLDGADRFAVSAGSGAAARGRLLHDGRVAGRPCRASAQAQGRDPHALGDIPGPCEGHLGLCVASRVRGSRCPPCLHEAR